MNYYTSVETLGMQKVFGSEKEMFSWVAYSSEGEIFGEGEVSSETVAFAKALKLINSEMWKADNDAFIQRIEANIVITEDDDDYGLTNEQGMGWSSADEKEEFETQPTKETKFVDDGFVGEIVVKKVVRVMNEDKSETRIEHQQFEDEYVENAMSSLFKPMPDTGLWIRATIEDGVCTGTYWHAPRVKLVGFGEVPDFVGKMLDELRNAGFGNTEESGLNQFLYR